MCSLYTTNSELMTFHSFRQFCLLTSVDWTFRHGTFLASRFEVAMGDNLYDCPDEERGFFVETGLAKDSSFARRSFVSSGLPEAYVPGSR